MHLVSIVYLAFISLFISVVAVIAVCYLTPLKSVEPYIIKVDQTTGLVDIVTKMNEKDITTTEAIDKHFISQYVKAREGYYYDMLQHDYVFVQLLSMPEVSKDYMALYQGENARDTKLSNSYTVLSNNVTYDCHARGKFRHDKISPLVGDYVSFDSNNNYILDIKERINLTYDQYNRNPLNYYNAYDSYTRRIPSNG